MAMATAGIMPCQARAIQDVNPDDAANLLKGANLALESTWFADGNWTPLPTQPDVTIADGAVSVTLPEGIGGAQWQGQVKLTTDVNLMAGEVYSLKYTVVTTANHPGVTVKALRKDDDGTFISDARTAFDAGENMMFVANKPGFDGNLAFVLDFGGGEAGSTVTVKDFVLVAGEMDTEPAPDFDETGRTNLLANLALDMTWFADGSWTELNPQPEVTLADGGFSVTIPEGMGGATWQAQVKLGTGMTVSADKEYSFKCLVDLESPSNAVVIKVGCPTDDNAFIGPAAPNSFPAGESKYCFLNQKGFDGDLQLIFDFAGCPVGSKATIKNLVLIDPSEQVAIESVTADNAAAPVYYNLQGLRVDNAANGIFIVKRGDKVTKELVK